MTRWLVTGAAGQVGTHVAARLRELDQPVTACARADLDITDAAAVAATVADVAPDVVVNLAAWTAVDAAESDEAAAARVNATGPRVLAEALAGTATRLLHVSTDYVFAGDAEEPYDVDDPTGPRTAYGRTKLAGEQAVRSTLPGTGCVVRTAWVYGGPGPNFVDTMLRLETERDTVDVVADQVGSPTAAPDLGAALVELGSLAGPLPALLHYANAGRASWFDLAREAFRLAGADPARVRPTDSTAFVRPAPRPAWSVLSTRSWTAAGLTESRSWQDALAAVVSVR